MNIKTGLKIFLFIVFIQSFTEAKISVFALSDMDIQTSLQSKDTLRINDKYKLIAHRGGITGEEFSEYDPESIDEAINRGYYGIEVDVRVTKDTVLIAHHDSDFMRVYNDPRKVSDVNWEEIKNLRATNKGYQPMKLETLLETYSGKIKFMVDVKSDSPIVFDKLGKLLEKYHLLNENTYFLGTEARKYFMNKVKFTFSIYHLNDMKSMVNSGVDISKNYYLFGSATSRMTSAAVKWCQKEGITAMVALNTHNYVDEDPMVGGIRDFEYWKNCGVEYFQIDSDYEFLFR